MTTTAAKSTYALFIYRTGDGALTEAQDHEALLAHRALQQLTGARGDLHAVARLDDDGPTKTVRRQGDAHAVTDGPYIEAKEWLVGFYLVDCHDEEEALAHARSLVPYEGHAIEVRPVQWKWEP